MQVIDVKLDDGGVGEGERKQRLRKSRHNRTEGEIPKLSNEFCPSML